MQLYLFWSCSTQTVLWVHHVPISVSTHNCRAQRGLYCNHITVGSNLSFKVDIYIFFMYKWIPAQSCPSKEKLVIQSKTRMEVIVFIYHHPTWPGGANHCILCLGAVGGGVFIMEIDPGWNINNNFTTASSHGVKCWFSIERPKH